VYSILHACPHLFLFNLIWHLPIFNLIYPNIALDDLMCAPLFCVWPFPWFDLPPRGLSNGINGQEAERLSPINNTHITTRHQYNISSARFKYSAYPASAVHSQIHRLPAVSPNIAFFAFAFKLASKANSLLLFVFKTNFINSKLQIANSTSLLK